MDNPGMDERYWRHMKGSLKAYGAILAAGVAIFIVSIVYNLIVHGHP